MTREYPHPNNMTPKSISALNLASKCFVRASKPLFSANRGSAAAVISKHFTSYSKPSQSYYDMYNQPAHYDTTESSKSFSELKVINNGTGSIVREEMTFIDNTQDDTYSIPDVPFVPSVCSDDTVSGQGHRNL
ncbi:hypothetical protein FOA43_001080 [Brettanomyces nanus]|uniref:Uncharacterized protein n=1 Tax=Eeniella nana TaxID=13502 RepID=A0A875RXH7_EENNA|nr:uncharacterized protein FOA43_001080 [Brettanomyces nanus]QPG73766.1 hypothetical protein FOA43_001080 [Brettanomyces nanus]